MPGWAPSPSQVGQTTAVSTESSFSAPNTASPRSMSMRMSASCAAPLARARAALAARPAAEEGVHDVAEPRSRRRRPAPPPEAGRPEVEHLPLGGSLSTSYAGVTSLNSLLGLGRGVHVGVQLAGQAAVGLLDLLRRGVAGHAQGLVVVAQGSFSSRVGRRRAGRDAGRMRADGLPVEHPGDVARDGAHGGHRGRVVHARRPEDAEASDRRRAPCRSPWRRRRWCAAPRGRSRGRCARRSRSGR